MGWDDTVTHQWISFISAITGSEDPTSLDYATFEDGAQAVRLADAIRESSRTSSPSRLTKSNSLYSSQYAPSLFKTIYRHIGSGLFNQDTGQITRSFSLQI